MVYEDKIMKKILLTILILCSLSSFGSTFYECEIFNGKVSYCGGWGQGQSVPVLQSDGSYRDCDVFNGHMSYCGSWSQQKSSPVLQSDGSYNDCSIFNGSVGSCNGWFSGKAIIEKQ